MKTCCDWECAAANSCQVGGYECERCGRYFCASELTEHSEMSVCVDCEQEMKEEENEEERDEE